MKETEPTAQALGVKLIPVVVRGPEGFDGAFQAMTKEQADAVIMRLAESAFLNHYKRLAELTAKNRLPAIATGRDWTDAGGLLSYGAEANAKYYRAATYIDKILKGAKPAELPVEAPMKFEFVINLKAAKQIGLTIPQNGSVSSGQSDQMTAGRDRVSGVRFQDKAQEKTDEKKVYRSYPLRRVLFCALLLRSGAAANENSADRLPKWCPHFR